VFLASGERKEERRMQRKTAGSKPQPRIRDRKAAEAIRTIWLDSRKKPKAYVDRFVVPSEGE
jgi:hypothetical protein